MTSPDNVQRHIAKIHEAARLREAGIDVRDPLLVVDALLKEVQEKGVHTISGIVTVASTGLELAFLKPEMKQDQSGESADDTVKRHDMTDLLQSLRELNGKTDEEMLTALRELKERLSDHRKRA